MKRVTLGDASTKFFRANATVKFRRNLISVLEDDDGHVFSDHADKASLIWNAFKERLGTSSFLGIHFDLSNLVLNGQDLSSLVAPFDKIENDSVIRHLPSDKSRGPDGFNIDFIKKC